MFNDLGARLPRLVELLEAWTMVFQLIRWVDLSRSLSTWRILKNMMLLLSPNRQVPPFAGNSSQGSKTPPNRGQQLARSLHKNFRAGTEN
jgi:hypothetical protein